MPIFTKQKSVNKAMEQSRFVGGYVPPTLHSFLSLCSMSSGISRSELLRALLVQWKERFTEKEIREMQQCLVQVAIRNYKSMPKKKRRLCIFMKDVEKELSPLLDKETLLLILKQIQDGAEK